MYCGTKLIYDTERVIILEFLRRKLGTDQGDRNQFGRQEASQTKRRDMAGRRDSKGRQWGWCCLAHNPVCATKDSSQPLLHPSGFYLRASVSNDVSAIMALKISAASYLKLRTK